MCSTNSVEKVLNILEKCVYEGCSKSNAQLAPTKLKISTEEKKNRKDYRLPLLSVFFLLNIEHFYLSSHVTPKLFQEL